MSPARRISARLTTSYAGFENESDLLHKLYLRGRQQPEIAPSLYAGDGLLMAWHHEPVAPWQDERWLAEMRRSLRPAQFLRMVENRFVSSESTFIDLAQWDACIDPNWSMVAANPDLSVHVGVNASVKHDSTAIVAVAFERATKRVRLVFHRVFQPSPNEPLDFEHTIEQTLRDLSQRFSVHTIRFDPYQMVAVSQKLQRIGLPLEEFPQTTGNLTAASQNLYELICARNLICYSDAAMRLAISRTVAVESARGWRLAKDKSSHKIDVVVALAMAAHAAVMSAGEMSSVEYFTRLGRMPRVNWQFPQPGPIITAPGFGGIRV